MSNVPASMSTLASLFPDIKAGGHKVRGFARSGELIRVKKGLYVVSPTVSRVPLSLELIANHVYSPSYVSMYSALMFYDLIPEAVYSIQSMTNDSSEIPLTFALILRLTVEGGFDGPSRGI